MYKFVADEPYLSSPLVNNYYRIPDSPPLSPRTAQFLGLTPEIKSGVPATPTKSSSTATSKPKISTTRRTPAKRATMQNRSSNKREDQETQEHSEYSENFSSEAEETTQHSKEPNVEGPAPADDTNAKQPPADVEPPSASTERLPSPPQATTSTSEISPVKKQVPDNSEVIDDEAAAELLKDLGVDDLTQELKQEEPKKLTDDDSSLGGLSISLTEEGAAAHTDSSLSM